MGRPTPDEIAPMAVRRWILEADSALAKACAGTDDRAIKSNLKRARRELRLPYRRACEVLRAARKAEQLELSE